MKIFQKFPFVIMSRTQPMKSGKKIAILHFSSPPVVGGVENVLYKHAQLLSEADYQVSIFSGQGDKIGKSIDYKKIPLLSTKNDQILKITKTLNSGSVPDNFSAISREIYSWMNDDLANFDIIIAHNICTLNKNLPLTAAFYKFCNDHPELPIIGWHHDLSWARSRNRKNLKDEWPWNITKSAWDFGNFSHVTISEARKKEIADILRVHEKKIRIIPSGVDTFQFHNISQETRKIYTNLRLDLKNPIILLPVRITRRKNLELALEILSNLGKWYPDAALIVTGPIGYHNPSNQLYLNELIKKKNGLDLIENKPDTPSAFFLAEFSKKFLPDNVIAELYRLSDCILITSKEEGFGIPIIEAGIAQKPVFCTRLPSFEEIACEEVHYFKVPENTGEIAKQMYDFFEKSKTYKLRRRVRKQYTWSAIFKMQILPLIKEIVSKS